MTASSILVASSQDDYPGIPYCQEGLCTSCALTTSSKACFDCKKPVCYNPFDVYADSTCGSWWLEWSHEPKKDNVFLCSKCTLARYRQEIDPQPIKPLSCDSCKQPIKYVCFPVHEPLLQTRLVCHACRSKMPGYASLIVPVINAARSFLSR